MKYTNDIYEMLNRIADNQERILARLDRIEESDDIILTPAQAASYLGISSATLCRWDKRGRISKELGNGVVGYSRHKLKPLKK